MDPFNFSFLEHENSSDESEMSLPSLKDIQKEVESEEDEIMDSSICKVYEPLDQIKNSTRDYIQSEVCSYICS